MGNITLLDCTLRDGGYYNAWDFEAGLISSYLAAMKDIGVNVVELGFRSPGNRGFRGACAYTTDDFIRALPLPAGMDAAVMVNAGDLPEGGDPAPVLASLFPETAETSPVRLVRIACHFHEAERALPTAAWLHARGYRVGINLMQAAGRSSDELTALARRMRAYPVAVLYFADSLGSMAPGDVTRLIAALRAGWDGPVGVHAHDNMGLALQNTLRALADGATWVDGTVAGMGRGAGNTRIEELAVEVAELREEKINIAPLMSLIRKKFQPLKERYGWGANPYYYLSGKYGIHPTYVQEMLGDPRYSEEDIIAVLNRLRRTGGRTFDIGALDGARRFYHGPAQGRWAPATLMANRNVLILGSGPSVPQHRDALESYIRRENPLVIALNTQSAIDSGLIHVRAACHPVRLLADCEKHRDFPQPLIVPASMLPRDLQDTLEGKDTLDFGIGIEPGCFRFNDMHCVVPQPLVLAYALAIARSGQARAVLLAGFDGYRPGDPRNREIELIFQAYRDAAPGLPVASVTPTIYENIAPLSVYGPLP